MIGNALGWPCSSRNAEGMAGFSQGERKTFKYASSHPVKTDICVSTALCVWLNKYY